MNRRRAILLAAGRHEVKTAKKKNGLPRQTAEKSSIFKGFRGKLPLLHGTKVPGLLHTHEVTGSSPVVSTKQNPHRKVWVFCLVERRQRTRTDQMRRGRAPPARARPSRTLIKSSPVVSCFILAITENAWYNRYMG